jgi:hypothetical protein
MAIVAYEEPKVIVIYNTKCAQSTLYDVFGSPWNRQENDYFKKPWSISDIAKLSDFSKKVNLDDYFVMDFVRNPYSRMTSLWAYAKEPGGTFERYINFCYEDWKLQRMPRFSYCISLNMFVDMEVDFIGKQETLDQDVQFIANKFGIEYQELPRLNISDNSLKKIEYSPEIKEMVAEMYAKDFEMFGYEA